MALQGARCFSSASLGLDFAASDGESEARFCSCFPLLVNIGEVLEHRALSSRVQTLFGSVIAQLLQNGCVLACGKRLWNWSEAARWEGTAVLTPAHQTSENNP